MALNYVEEVALRIRNALGAEFRPNANATELYLLYALLALAKGEETTLRDVHDAWSVWMIRQDPDHPAIRPFEELDQKTKEEDKPYLQAIQRALQVK